MPHTVSDPETVRPNQHPRPPRGKGSNGSERGSLTRSGSVDQASGEFTRGTAGKGGLLRLGEPRSDHRAGGFQPPFVGCSKSKRLRAGHPQRGGWKPPARACRVPAPYSPFPIPYSIHLAASSRRTI